MTKCNLRIMLLTRSFNYGGAERQIVTLAKELHKHGHEIIVTVFSNGPLEIELNQAGVPFYVLEKRSRLELGFFWRLLQLINQNQPTIIYSFLGVPNVVNLLVKLFFPKTAIVWGVRCSYLDAKDNDWLSRIWEQLEIFLSRFPNLIIANSQAGFDNAISNGFPQNSMIVIPNGIDTTKFYPHPKLRQKFRNLWRVTEDEMLIGRIGRLHPMKDYPTFLKAAAELAKEKSNVRFVCVGNSLQENYTQELYQLTNQLGLSHKVIWAGAQANMCGVYNALDIFVSSSSYGEGFPNVIGEAMACGITCIVTDVGDSAWIVSDIGLVIPPENPATLKMVLKQILESNNHDSSKTATIRQHILNHFSLEQLRLQTENALLKVLE